MYTSDFHFQRFIFAIEISDPYILQEVFKIAQECRGTIVKVIDKNRPPDALISDAKHAPYLQHHSYEENMKVIKTYLITYLL